MSRKDIKKRYVTYKRKWLIPMLSLLLLVLIVIDALLFAAIKDLPKEHMNEAREKETSAQDSTETYEVEEGCLSLEGIRKTVRHKSIKVEYLNIGFKKTVKNFSDYEAQIIQHEMDHFEGILI